MKKAHKERLERAGWKVGTASELLGLTEAEEALVEAKLRLGDVVRTLRQEKHLSQAELAKLMGSSQSRVAKVENRDPEVSLELQMKAVFAASPSARREFEGLIRKWSLRRRSTSVARGTVSARGRRQSPRPGHEGTARRGSRGSGHP
jgi:transcriptional regulator with XRE-family HTH domain